MDFERTYEEHRAAVHAAALRIVRDPAVAHDVTQDVFLRLWRDPSCFDPSRGDIGAFLKRMGHNRALDLHRRSRSSARATERLTVLAERAEAPVEVLPGAATERAAAATEIRAAVRRLPDAQREAVVLAYWGGLPIPDVASLTKTPLGTAKSRVRLGLERLRAEPALAGF